VVGDGKAAAEATENEESEDAGPAPAAPTAPVNGKATEPAAGYKGLSFQSMTAAPQVKKGAAVDLAAWGRGHKDYPFNELRTAVETQLSVVVTDPRAALEALIDKGRVRFEEARDDLMPKVEVEDYQDA
jgi:hypothetical protein